MAVTHCHCAGAGHEPVADVPMRIIVSKEDPHVEKVTTLGLDEDAHVSTT